MVSCKGYNMVFKKMDTSTVSFFQMTSEEKKLVFSRLGSQPDKILFCVPFYLPTGTVRTVTYLSKKWKVQYLACLLTLFACLLDWFVLKWNEWSNLPHLPSLTFACASFLAYLCVCGSLSFFFLFLIFSHLVGVVSDARTSDERTTNDSQSVRYVRYDTGRYE